MSCIKKDAMLVLKELFFITNYFSKTNNKLLLFITDSLCGISFLAEQSALLINTSQLYASCSENNKKTMHATHWTRCVQNQDISCICSAPCHSRIGQGEGFLL